MTGKMMSVKSAEIVRSIFDRAREENRTDMWIIKELSAAGFERKN